MSAKNICLQALCLLIAMSCTQPARAAEQCKPLYGMTITHYVIDADAHCKNGHDSAFVMAKGAIIPQYDDPGVRGKVKQILDNTLHAGYGMVRTVVWFTQDKIMVPWGQLHAPLEPDDARRIHSYGEDIRSTGFKKWLVVFGPGIGNNPACKLVTWGDCYDATREAANFQFIKDVHSLLAPLNSSDFRVEYDISGEMCPSRYLPAASNEKIISYISHLVAWYSHSISATDFHISCGGFGDDRERLMLDIFDRAGVKPNEIDMHLYDEDPVVIARKLLPAADMARQRQIPIIIGEMQYENIAESTGIARLAHSHDICFSEVIEWPLRGTSICQINVNPPFSPRIVRSEMEAADQ